MTAIHGFIKLNRTMLDWEWYQDGNTLRVFFHLLLTANYKNARWCGIEIKRGQLVTSHRSLTAALDITERALRTALSHLEATHYISVEPKNRYSIITVCGYDTYIDSGEYNGECCDEFPAEHGCGEISDNVPSDETGVSDTVSDTVSATQKTALESDFSASFCPAAAHKRQANDKQTTGKRPQLNNNNKNKNDNKEKRERGKAAPPSPADVSAFCRERNFSFDPERFYNYYSAVGWKRGSTAITNWKSLCENWERREYKHTPPPRPKAKPPIDQRSTFDVDALSGFGILTE